MKLILQRLNTRLLAFSKIIEKTEFTEPTITGTLLLKEINLDEDPYEKEYLQWVEEALLYFSEYWERNSAGEIKLKSNPELSTVDAMVQYFNITLEDFISLFCTYAQDYGEQLRFDSSPQELAHTIRLFVTPPPSMKK